MPFVRPARFYRFNQTQSAAPPPPPPPPPPASGAIYTLRVANSAGSTQSSGAVSPMLGLWFKRGDVSGDSYPRLKTTAGDEVPTTIYNKTTWDDGTWKLCGAMFRIPQNVPASANGSIEVWGDGSAGVSAAVSLHAVTAAGIVDRIIGVSGLAGTWDSDLSIGVTAATDVVKIADGPAGSIWRVGQAYVSGGTESHGQLYGRHYVAVLQNNSGGLQGVRHLGRADNGWANVSTDANRRIVEFKKIAGGSTLRTLLGCGDSSETLQSAINMPHYTGFFDCSSDARWDYFQAGGSLAADTNVRILFPSSYYKTAALTPPWDTSAAVGTNSAYSYYPNENGPLTRAMGTTGDREDIGVLPTWASMHFINQTQADDRTIRVVGLIGAAWRTNLRRSDTKAVVSVASANYTGMGSSQSTWQYAGSTITGFVTPANQTTQWVSEIEPSHRPSVAYYPYLVTGEPQYLDLLQEHASQIIAHTIPGINTFNSLPVSGNWFTTGAHRGYTVSATTYGICTLINGTNIPRVPAWMTRDVIQAYAASPDVDPAGTDVKEYFSSAINSSFDCINAFNNEQPQSWRDNGFYYFRSTSQEYEGGWNLSYMAQTVAHGYMLTRRSNVAEFRDHLAKRFAAAENNGGIASMAGQDHLMRDKPSNYILSESSGVVYELANGLLTWSSAEDTLQFGPGGNNNFTNVKPQNGDMFAFRAYYSPTVPFASTPDGKIYYAVNASAQSCQLASAPGGAALDITTSGAIGRLLAKLADVSGIYSFQGGGSGPDPGGNLANTRAGMRFLVAAGASACVSARDKQDENWINNGGSFSANPKWAYDTTF